MGGANLECGRAYSRMNGEGCPVGGRGYGRGGARVWAWLFECGPGRLMYGRGDGRVGLSVGGAYLDVGGAMLGWGLWGGGRGFLPGRAE